MDSKGKEPQRKKHMKTIEVELPSFLVKFHENWMTSLEDILDRLHFSYTGDYHHENTPI